MERLHPPMPADTALSILARDDFELFVRMAFAALEPTKTLSKAWYLSALSDALQRTVTGDLTRLLVTIPPRYLKSIMTSVLLCAWILGRDPAARIICASYGQDLTASHTRNFRKVIRSTWYRKVFPAMSNSVVRDTDSELHTKQGGFRFATAVGGTVTGIGADYIIIDDLMKAADVHFSEAREKHKRFIDETLLSRFDNKKTGRLISIQQRLHEDDCVAHLREKNVFYELELPAIAVEDVFIPLTHGRIHHRKIGDVLDPEREPREELDRLRAEMGSRAFEAQYQQNPTPPESEFIRWDKIQRYDAASPREQMERVVISWDTASSPEAGADYSVGTVWGFADQFWHLLDLIRIRVDYSDLLARVRYERSRWHADMILVERAGVGFALLSELAKDFRCIGPVEHHAPYCGRRAADPRMPKHERMLSQVERLYSGLAKLPSDAPWLKDLRRELTTFPAARHDDQVDSISQFLNYAGSTPALASVGMGSRGRRSASRPRRRMAA